MKYTMSMALNKEHLKQLIISDREMTDMEKLRDVFTVDGEEVAKQFPQLYTAICDVLFNERELAIKHCDKKYKIFLPRIGICCRAYSASKRPDGLHCAHYPDCKEENCPLVHPELLKGAILEEN